MTVQVNGSEIILTGFVGESWFDDGFTSGEVIAALAEVGHTNDVTIRLNSGGGYATEGSAIHATLARHAGRKTVVIEGVAASAASVIAMAGDEVVMSLGAVMMVHEPSGLTFGTVEDHQITITQLEAIAGAVVGIYAEKTGRTAEQCRADMKAELWMTPEKAVELGYADSTSGSPANDNEAAEEPAVAAFDYRIYAHAPRRLVALSRSNGWRLDASGRPSSQPKGPAMTTQPNPSTAPSGQPQPAAPGGGDNVVQLAAARDEGVAYAQEVIDLCTLAGRPQMASDYLGKKAPLATVRAELLAARAEAGDSNTVQSHSPAGNQRPAQLRVDIAADMRRRNGISA